jgi:hypothetical protein
VEQGVSRVIQLLVRFQAICSVKLNELYVGAVTQGNFFVDKRGPVQRCGGPKWPSNPASPTVMTVKKSALRAAEKRNINNYAVLYCYNHRKPRRRGRRHA